VKIITLSNRNNQRVFVCGSKGFPIPDNAVVVGEKINIFGIPTAGTSTGVPHIMVGGIEKKYCHSCKKWSPVSEFVNYVGRRYVCKDCVNKRISEEKYAGSLRARRKRNRKQNRDGGAVSPTNP
jgi:hypothetical protein